MARAIRISGGDNVATLLDACAVGDLMLDTPSLEEGCRA